MTYKQTVQVMVVDQDFVESMKQAAPEILKLQEHEVAEQFRGIQVLVEQDVSTRWAIALAIAALGEVVAVLRDGYMVFLDKQAVQQLVENFSDEKSVVVKPYHKTNVSK